MKKQTITIRVGRLASPIEKMRVKKGTTIREVMKKLSASEEIYTGVSINGIQPLDTILEDDDFLILVFPVCGEATVRRNGNSWRIHPNDLDNVFPSDFHAHNIETGEKLDLYTGYLYSPNTKKLLCALHRKDWFAILLKLRMSKEKAVSLKAETVLNSFNTSSSNRFPLGDYK